MAASGILVPFSLQQHRSNLAASRDETTSIDMPEIIAALSFALDLTEGAVPGHALRSCILGMRIAKRAGLAGTQMRELYYALLLKDVGCSSNSARMCQIVGGGDDRAIKAGVKLEDWTKPHNPSLAMMKMLWTNVLPEGSATERLARIAKIGLTQHKNNAEMIALRCDRGASIVRKIGFLEGTAEGVRSLDEHWNGSGYPDKLKGSDIPILARIAALSQHLDVFSHETSVENAISVMHDRSGKWFDPELVLIAAALDREGKLWSDCVGATEDQTRQAVRDLEPSDTAHLGANQIDKVCEGFSDVVDAKSPFTYRHSMGVAEAASIIAQTLGFSPERMQLVRRAALLHDIGKLRVPNSILDKPGKLTSDEFLIVQEHPALTQQILGRIPAFRQMAIIAGAHHEKLDGTGYPYHLVAGELTEEARIIAVADVYAALSEERPYRESLDLKQITDIMSRDIPHRMDPECFEALLFGLTKVKASA